MRTIRKITQPWESTDAKGNLQTKEIVVEYYGLTVKDLRENEASFKEKTKEGKRWYVSDTLASRIHLFDGQKVDLEWLEEQDLTNLLNLEKSINEDENPEKK